MRIFSEFRDFARTKVEAYLPPDLAAALWFLLFCVVAAFAGFSRAAVSIVMFPLLAMFATFLADKFRPKF